MEFFNLKCKSAPLVQDLQSHLSMIELANTCITTITTSSEFVIALFSEPFLVEASLAQFNASTCFLFCFVDPITVIYSEWGVTRKKGLISVVFYPL